jgi:glutamine amidotransferase
MVVIIDYEVGNVGSVYNMIKKIGHECTISNDKNCILNASHIILPGVGSFDHGMQQLNKFGLIEIIHEANNLNIPILGICLGMQLLGTKSEEGNVKGLSLLNFEVVKFKTNNLQIPHVGWNTINIKKVGDLFKELNYNKFYFTHSYHVIVNDSKQIISTTDYGYEFVSAVSDNNIFGVQFHPEKSHKYGMLLLKNFLNVTK